MSNPNNNGNVIGRLAADPKVFPNQDGSSKVLISVYADNNFKSRNGDWGSQAIPLETFVNAGTDVARTPYGSAHEGDVVAVTTHLENQKFQRGGQTVYELKAIADDIWFVEPKRVRDARRASKLEAENQKLQAQAPAAAPAPAPQAQPDQQPVAAGAVGDDEPPF